MSAPACSPDPHVRPPVIPRPRRAALADLPADLKAERRWCCWTYAERGGRTIKLPLMPDGRPAKANDPDTWVDFDSAMRAAEARNWGLGIMLGNGIIGVDLDGCVNEDGSIERWAHEIATALDTYCETSPSGKGLHLLLRATAPGSRCRVNGVEIYSGGRFFTITGQRLNGRGLEERSAELKEIYLKLFGPDAPQPSDVVTLPTPPAADSGEPEPLDDDDKALIAAGRALPGEAGELFSALWDGNVEGLIGAGRQFNSRSEVDLSLASRLLRLCDGNVERATKLFRNSGLAREKWATHRSYIARTMRKAAQSYHRFRENSQVEGLPAAAAVGEDDGKKKNFYTTERLAEEILKTDHFALSIDNILHVFRGGTYVPDGDLVIQKRVQEILEKAGEPWTTRKGLEVVNYIRLKSPTLWSEPPQHIVNVSNGLLDTRSGTLAPHSPDFLWHVQYSIRFDREADCPAWTQFLRDILPPDCTETFWDLMAWTLFPWVPEQRALLLLGDGSNGKSALLAAIGSLLGPRNVTALSLQKLENDKFALARLAGITANICADLPSEALQSTQVFKALTGDDFRLTAEHKYHKSFEFKPFCRLLFSANLPPRSNDSSSGFWRRWWVINFTREFKAGDPGVLPRNVLDARLADPREKSGVLNKALAALPGVLQRGVRETPSMLAAKAEFREVSDPIGQWLDASVIEQPDAMIPKSALYNAYLQFCNRRGLAAPTQSSFARSLKRLRPRVEDSRRMIGDKFTHVYVGIRLRAEDYEE